MPCQEQFRLSRSVEIPACEAQGVADFGAPGHTAGLCAFHHALGGYLPDGAGRIRRSRHPADRRHQPLQPGGRHGHDPDGTVHRRGPDQVQEAGHPAFHLFHDGPADHRGRAGPVGAGRAGQCRDERNAADLHGGPGGGPVPVPGCRQDRLPCGSDQHPAVLLHAAVLPGGAAVRLPAKVLSCRCPSTPAA